MKKLKTRPAHRGNQTGKLPQECHASPSVGSTVSLILGALVVTGAINLTAISLLKGSPYNRGYRRIQQTWDKLQNQDGPPDWLVLGDSGCGNAVAPEILAESLEGSVTELCTIGDMGLLDDAWLLDAHIEIYGPPKGVLIVHVYDVWQRSSPPLGLVAHVPRPLGYWKTFEPVLDLNWHESLDVAMARHLPLVGARESLENLVNGKLKELLGEPAKDSNDRQIADTASIKRDFRQHIAYAASTRFAIAPKNLEALDRIVALADEYGFDIYLANGPLWEGLAANQDFQTYNYQLEAVLAAYAQGKPSVNYLAGTMTFDLYSMTRTVDHIQAGPAISYSRDIAERIVAQQVEN